MEAVDIFTNNHRWGDMNEWNHAALALHERGGVHRIEDPRYPPFWAVIDHAALLDIERRPALFTNAPESVLAIRHALDNRKLDVKTLIHLDGDHHAKMRRLTADWFKPSSLDRLDGRLDELTEQALGRMAGSGTSCDFARDIALPYPLQVILKILGLPESDYDRMLMLTQQLFGGEDPDLQRAAPSPEVQAQVIGDFYQYFAGLTAARRSDPTDDLATLIANGAIDGEPLPELERMGYYLIIATAGHDTTSSAMSGGVQALAEHPEQLALLQARPELIPNAVEEMIRWSAPVRHFMRTAQDDTEVCGQPIAKGDWLYLSYKAANLDPKVFDEPLRFDVTRLNAAKHVAFGYGVHFCLGAQLARLELRSLFTALVARLESLQLDGEPTFMKTTFVGGHKSLPIRYRLRA